MDSHGMAAATTGGRQRFFKIIPLVLAPIIAATGCAATKPVQPAPATSSAGQASTSRPAETTKKPEMIKSSPLPGARAGNNVRVMRGAATVYNPCAPESSANNEASFNAKAEIFNPKTGQNVPIPVPSIPAGQHVVSGSCTVGGDADHIRVFYILTTSTPSSGLTPEAQSTSIYAFDPFAPGQPQIAPLPADIDPTHIGELIPTEYGFIIVTRSGDEYDGFDGTTLTKTYGLSLPGIWKFSNTKAILRTSPGQVTVYDARDGQVIGQYAGTVVNNPSDTYPDGFVTTTAAVRDGHYESGYFNLTDRQLKTPFPGSGDVWGQTFLSLDTHSLTIRNLMDNSVTLERTGKDFDGLHITNAYIAGNYVYIANDSDNPVIDITTSQKVSTGWKLRPTDAVGRDWVLVKTETQGSRSAGSCFSTETATSRYDDNELTCSPSEVTLKYAPGGKYDGPWF